MGRPALISMRVFGLVLPGNAELSHVGVIMIRRGFSSRIFLPFNSPAFCWCASMFVNKEKIMYSEHIIMILRFIDCNHVRWLYDNLFIFLVGAGHRGSPKQFEIAHLSIIWCIYGQCEGSCTHSLRN